MHYHTTVFEIMRWAESELEHVGRIASMRSDKYQRAYAISTLFGMGNLRNALAEMMTNRAYSRHRVDLHNTYETVVRTMQHMMKVYSITVEDMRATNSQSVLGSLGYLKSRKTRKTRRNR